ncbi:MAG: GIY-YIG nuclease family protein [Lachnospiraceae bacterium]|nr:GIY-YIG nuclease family protein [Lachnospiraceae bacterium]
MRELIIDSEKDGMRLDRVLAGYLKAADSGFLHKMLRKKNIVVNGKKADGAFRVTEGDTVTLFLAEDTIGKFLGQEDKTGTDTERLLRAYETVRGDDGESVAIIYEDDALLLVNKPGGVLSQKDRSGKASLNDWLRGYLLSTGRVTEESLADFSPSVVNRLDRNTTGLIVCAKTRSAARAFAALQQSGATEKTYLTVVCGRSRDEGSVRRTVRQDGRENRVYVTDREDGTDESLSYRLLHYDEKTDASLLRVRLKEGKKHQIRAQLAGEGLPVAGDYKYGNRQRNDMWKAVYGVRAQLLHSFLLTFPRIADGVLRPVSGRTFVAPSGGLFERVATGLYAGRDVVYIMQCADGSLYCGYTNDIARRVQAHNSGQGAKYTRGRTPVHPVYIRAFETKEAAMREEWRIKQLSRAGKLALIG